jgi:hypothetical protein
VQDLDSGVSEMHDGRIGGEICKRSGIVGKAESM